MGEKNKKNEINDIEDRIVFFIALIYLNFIKINIKANLFKQNGLYKKK